VSNWEFVDVVDGKKLKPTKEIEELFKSYGKSHKKMVIGCALSHINLWKQLIEDDESEYYLILEDDVTFTTDFSKKLEKCIQMFGESDIEYLLIGGFQTKEECKNIESLLIINAYSRVYQANCHGTASYIIRKSACKK
jgi:GR25 family glycosyltransferase involved in LPS biosynthesis